MIIWSLFTHIVPNLYDFLCSVNTKYQKVSVHIDFHYMDKNTMEVNGNGNIYLCVSAEERNAYRIETWRWVNNDRIFIFGVKYHFKIIYWSLDTLLKIKVLNSDAIEEAFLVPQRTIQSKNISFWPFYNLKNLLSPKNNLLWNRKMLKVHYGTI